MVSPSRVLYSEDDTDTREMLQLLLANAGFEVTCAESAVDFLRLAKEGQFDIYLLDNWMPDLSGAEVCAQVREVDPTTPIVFYSAAAYKPDKQKAFAAGAQAYITKPGNIDQLIQTLRKFSPLR